MLRLFQKKYRIYCQECFEEIVGRGGYVSSEGKIYCLNEINNVFTEKISDPSFSVEYMTADEVQQLIQERKLTSFGKLECSLKG